MAGSPSGELLRILTVREGSLGLQLHITYRVFCLWSGTWKWFHTIPIVYLIHPRHSF